MSTSKKRNKDPASHAPKKSAARRSDVAPHPQQVPVVDDRSQNSITLSDDGLLWSKKEEWNGLLARLRNWSRSVTPIVLSWMANLHYDLQSMNLNSHERNSKPRRVKKKYDSVLVSDLMWLNIWTIPCPALALPVDFDENNHIDVLDGEQWNSLVTDFARLPIFVGKYAKRDVKPIASVLVSFGTPTVYKDYWSQELASDDERDEEVESLRAIDGNEDNRLVMEYSVRDLLCACIVATLYDLCENNQFTQYGTSSTNHCGESTSEFLTRFAGFVSSEPRYHYCETLFDNGETSTMDVESDSVALTAPSHHVIQVFRHWMSCLRNGGVFEPQDEEEVNTMLNTNIDADNNWIVMRKISARVIKVSDIFGDLVRSMHRFVETKLFLFTPPHSSSSVPKKESVNSSSASLDTKKSTPMIRPGDADAIAKIKRQLAEIDAKLSSQSFKYRRREEVLEDLQVILQGKNPLLYLPVHSSAVLCPECKGGPVFAEIKQGGRSLDEMGRAHLVCFNVVHNGKFPRWTIG